MSVLQMSELSLREVKEQAQVCQEVTDLGLKPGSS